MISSLDFVQIGDVDVQLPLHLFVENHAVGCVFGCKGFALILHAEHHEWFCTVVANRALAGWCYSHHASLLNREYLAVKKHALISKRLKKDAQLRRSQMDQMGDNLEAMQKNVQLWQAFAFRLVPHSVC